jgi:hypothetical protein
LQIVVTPTRLGHRRAQVWGRHLSIGAP